MDRDRFDALARLLAAKGSRRGALGALLGAALFGQDSDGGLANPGKKGASRGKGRRRGNGAKDRGKRRDTQPGNHRARQAQAEAVSCCSTGNCTPGKGKNLEKCCYQGQNLSGANFTDANLGSANFSGATLTGARFRGANLGKACLVDADLRGVTFDSSTNLGGAVFCRTLTDSGEDNSGCGRGTACCATCDAANSCDDGQVCCNGRCRDSAGEPPCCVVGDCADRACQTKACTGFQCVYTPVTGPSPNRQCGTTCCNGVCCEQGQICDSRPNPAVCCTPQSDNVACGVGTSARRCGQVTNNCGQTVNCGDCPAVTCRTVACQQTTCAVTGNQPDRSTCTTAAGVAGICCNGTCVAGNCCGNADCTGSTNTCTNNQCRCGSGPACIEPNETCCGAAPQGACTDTTTNPNRCGSCTNVCPTGRCVDGECAPCISNANCGADRVCCGGQCFTGVCCALRGQCGPDAPCCPGFAQTPPDRACCIRDSSGATRCCLRNGRAGEPGGLTTLCQTGDCCTDICLAGIEGTRICGPANIDFCPPR